MTAATEWTREAAQTLRRRLVDELAAARTSQLHQDEAAIYKLQDSINALNEQRHTSCLELRNVDRKINFLVQSRLQKDVTRDKEAWFEFFDQSASQDNPLGLKKSDYSSFLYLLRLEPAILAKALMAVPFGDMDYVVRILNFSLFPDLFQAREEIFLLELIKHVIEYQVQSAAQPQDMFRQNSFVSKLLSGYTKRHHGHTHLITCLKDIVSQFIVEGREDGAFEMRPETLYRTIAGDSFDNSKTEEEMEKYPGVRERQLKAKERLEVYVWRVLNSIKEHLPSLPFGIRYVCKQMLLMAAKKFDMDEKQQSTLISSFLILRYFNPPLLVPEGFGLADREINGNMRRSLTQLTKILQSYANQIVLGGKESYMAIFNDNREAAVQLLKEYCFSVANVPEPSEYYATVANLPQRKDEFSIFHNTTITITPNELYTIHKLIASQRDELIPQHHPLNFFLNKVDPVPEKVPRAEDKFFTIQLAGGDEDGSENEDNLLVKQQRATVEALAEAFIALDVDATPLPEDLGATSQNVVAWLNTASTTEHEAASAAATAMAAINKLPQHARNDTWLLSEAERYMLHRQAYRSSLAKEKLEMEKSIETLQSEVQSRTSELDLWTTYLNNIVNTSFKAKIASKKEYQANMHIGPLEFSFATLERASCFVLTSNVDSHVKKTTVFKLSSFDPGVAEMVVKTDNRESRTLRLHILSLLDLLVSQDHIKIEGFLFDIRGLCAFLNDEICA